MLPVKAKIYTSRAKLLRMIHQKFKNYYYLKIMLLVFSPVLKVVSLHWFEEPKLHPGFLRLLQVDENISPYDLV